MKVLLLSAYAAQSHVYWQDQLRLMFADWDWHILTLPPRHFSWRIRGTPLYWSVEKREVLTAPMSPDLLPLHWSQGTKIYSAHYHPTGISQNPLMPVSLATFSTVRTTG